MEKHVWPQYLILGMIIFRIIFGIILHGKETKFSGSDSLIHATFLFFYISRRWFFGML